MATIKARCSLAMLARRVARQQPAALAEALVASATRGELQQAARPTRAARLAEARKLAAQPVVRTQAVRAQARVARVAAAPRALAARRERAEATPEPRATR